MARGTGTREGRQTKIRKTETRNRVEHRLQTPRADLAVVKIGTPVEGIQVLPQELASGVVAKIAKAMEKPGLRRSQIFQGASRKVYAYSIDSKDPSRIVRLERSGQKVLGRFVDGRFRPLSRDRAL